MNRKLLVLGALVVVLAAVGLVIWLRPGADDAAPEAAPGRASEGSAVVVSTQPGGTAAPQLPAGSGAPALPAGDSRDYMVGDVHVRDHRAGDNKPLDIPPNIHPAESRQIPSTLTHAIAQQVKDVMMRCAADVPREARGPKPRLEGQLMVSIKDHVLTVDKATMKLRDVFGAAEAPTQSCVEQGAVGLTTDAGEQADLEDYSIRISFALL